MLWLVLVFALLLDFSITSSSSKDMDNSQVMDIPHERPPVSLQCDEPEPNGNSILHRKDNDTEYDSVCGCTFRKRVVMRCLCFFPCTRITSRK